MESPSDLSGTLDIGLLKPYAAAKKVYKLHFYDSSGNYANINIDPEIINKLGLTEDDRVTQHIVSEGILLKRFRGGV